MNRANPIANPITIMHILANHHPPPTQNIMAVLLNPDPAVGSRSTNPILTRLGVCMHIQNDRMICYGTYRN